MATGAFFGQCHIRWLRLAVSPAHLAALLVVVVSVLATLPASATVITDTFLFLDNRANDNTFGINGPRLQIEGDVFDPLGLPGNVLSATATHTTSGNVYPLFFIQQGNVDAPTTTFSPYLRNSSISLFPPSDRTGSYIIDVLNAQGETLQATTQVLTATEQLPVATNIQISGNVLAPTVTSNAIPGADRYQLRIWESNINRIFNSTLEPSPTFVVPDGTLSAGETFSMSVRGLDFDASRNLERRSANFVSYTPADELAFTFTAPFYKDHPHKITQGPGGAFSHADPVFRLFDNAIDFAQEASAGQVPVLASAGGTARLFPEESITPGRNFGNFATIDHAPDPKHPNKRIFTVYAHLDRFAVSPGQEVEAGDIVGYEGRTGFATGNHIHWDVFSGDPTQTPFPLSVNEDRWQNLGLAPGTVGLLLGSSRAGPFSPFNTDTISSLICASGEACPVFSSIEHPATFERTGTITPGARFSFGFLVDILTDLALSLLWPGSELGLDVINPEGLLVAHFQDTDGSITETVPSATPGVWLFQISGLDVDPAGESFALRVRDLRAVTEPGTVALFTGGLFCIVLLVRYRKDTKSMLFTR